MKVATAVLAGVGLVALLIGLPWLTRRRWSTTHRSMWERRGGS